MYRFEKIFVLLTCFVTGSFLVIAYVLSDLTRDTGIAIVKSEPVELGVIEFEGVLLPDESTETVPEVESSEIVMDGRELNFLIRRHSNEKTVGSVKLSQKVKLKDVASNISMDIEDSRVKVRVSLIQEVATKIPEVKSIMDLAFVKSALSEFGLDDPEMFDADVSGEIIFKRGKFRIKNVIIRDSAGNQIPKALVNSVIKQIDMDIVAEELRKEGIKEIYVQNGEMRIVKENEPVAHQ